MLVPRVRLLAPALALGLFGAACVTAGGESLPPDGSSSGHDGSSASGGSHGSGGSASGGSASGGGTGTGLPVGSGGSGVGTMGGGGTPGSGGASSGGTTGSGGVTSSGGTVAASGGATGSGGRPPASGGTVGTGGMTMGAGGRGAGNTGGPGTGGVSGPGGGSGSGNTTGISDPCSVATVPSGGTKHMTNNQSGNAGGLNWTIWSSGSGGSITTYDSPAFSASWNNSGDFLARLGLQWNQTKTYDQYGTITAQFNAKKSGSGGGYSYVGIYGWSVSPCIEYYIVDDSYNKMPVNPGNTQNKGTVMIDGGSYILYTRQTTGTGGSKCSNTTSWNQFYSVRQTARSCGQISISEHFKAWAAAGMTLGKMDQAQLLIEVGGGSGSIDFTAASVTTTGP